MLRKLDRSSMVEYHPTRSSFRPGAEVLKPAAEGSGAAAGGGSCRIGGDITSKSFGSRQSNQHCSCTNSCLFNERAEEVAASSWYFSLIWHKQR